MKMTRIIAKGKVSMALGALQSAGFQVEEHWEAGNLRWARFSYGEPGWRNWAKGVLTQEGRGPFEVEMEGSLTHLLEETFEGIRLPSREALVAGRRKPIRRLQIAEAAAKILRGILPPAYQS